MHVHIRRLALVSSLVLAGCGGGGDGGGNGGGPSVVAAPPQIAITESNAKPLTADAVEAVQNTSVAQGGADLVSGVDVRTAGAQTSNMFMAMAQAAQIAASSRAGAALATGVAVNETHTCPLGGSLTITATVASQSGLTAGDKLSIVASSCQVSIDGVPTTMNGRMVMDVVDGSMGSMTTFHIVLTVETSDFSIATQASATTGASRMSSSGDVRLDWTSSTSTSQAMVATGSSLTSQITKGGTSRTRTLKNYTQAVSSDGVTVTSSLNADVESSRTSLGSNGASYSISTPLAMVWTPSTGVVTAGVIKVVGAAGSQLQATMTGSSVVSIQVDANGDGTFEKTITSSIAELQAQP